MLGGFRVYAQFMGVGASSTFGYMRSSVDVWCLALRWPWWLDLGRSKRLNPRRSQLSPRHRPTGTQQPSSLIEFFWLVNR